MHGKVDSLLNDQRVNYLADLFLARYNIRSAKRYRYVRNAVVLLSRGIGNMREITELLAECCDTTYEKMYCELIVAVTDVPEPISTVFNRHYCYPRYPQEVRPDNIEMRADRDPEYILSFLGGVFLYVVVTDYPVYDLVVETDIRR